MRTITKEAVRNFFNGTNYRKSNTEVKNYKNKWQNETCLYLHGNEIAIYDRLNKKLKVCDCGRQTNTTKERLNGILDRFWIGIYQKDFIWYFTNGKKWKYKARNNFNLI